MRVTDDADIGSVDRVGSPVMGAIVVHGRVVGQDRKPLVGASVMFSRGPIALPDIAQLTDSDGRFQLTAPLTGNYRILVNALGFRPVEQDAAIVEGAIEELNIVLGEKDEGAAR